MNDLPPFPDPAPAPPPAPRPASLGRRALPAVVLIGLGAGLLGLLDHPSAQEVDASGAIPADGSAPETEPTTAPRSTGGAPSTQVPSTTQEVTDGGVPESTGTSTSNSTTTTTRARSTTSTTSAPTTTVPATPGTCDGQTATGSSVSTRFGPLQVKATLTSSGQLCDVTPLTWPRNDGKSSSINQRALPTLETRAVAANGTSFNAVTGATITSNAYKQSLQSALDQAR